MSSGDIGSSPIKCINHGTNTEDFAPDAQTKTLCYKMEAMGVNGAVIKTYGPICIPPWQDEKTKNPTISNAQSDLVGSNLLESIDLNWDTDDRAVEYRIFRAYAVDGPFVDIGQLLAKANRNANAEDFTSEAQIKTLCYKIEARNAQGKTIRIYEPICIPPWQK